MHYNYHDNPKIILFFKMFSLIEKLKCLIFKWKKDYNFISTDVINSNYIDIFVIFNTLER